MPAPPANSQTVQKHGQQMSLGAPVLPQVTEDMVGHSQGNHTAFPQPTAFQSHLSLGTGEQRAPAVKTTPVQAPGERITFDIPLL